MLNVGGPEVIVILLVALIVLGPKDLPRVMRAMGKAQSEIKKYTGLLQAQAQDMVAPLTEALNDVTNPTPAPADTAAASTETV
ncbi:MAG: hypothetical protein JWN46_3746, partial [Acidimicrobiales bacterium]|nr:hypothetical protein [Acidimicrobiales bacterium]